MFRQLAAALAAPNPPDPAIGGPLVFDLHPMQLSRYLEEQWSLLAPANLVPSPSGLGIPGALLSQERTSGITVPTAAKLWDHLIYAYMVENTRAYEIFRRVLEEYVYGERLGIPSDASQRWLRTTEQLFYGPESPLQIYEFATSIRPDERANRRNAYFRMFGMDLNHGTDDDRPYPYVRPTASNTEFVGTFEDFLREVWRGVENFTNTSGPRPTDDAAIASLARKLFDMLTVRRRGGNLSREELFHVSAMSWFHLTLSWNSPIVHDLKADASAPEERLFKVGQQVGLPAQSRSAAYFRLADSMSLILRAIELAQFNSPAQVPALYQPITPTIVYDSMLAIVRDWSIATGRDMKGRQVSVAPPRPAAIRPPSQPIVPAGSNGRSTPVPS